MDSLLKRAWRYLSLHFEHQQIGLIIDEVGFRKWGKHSACIARQWLGCIGKQDNGQVFVAATLCAGKLFSIVRMKLFMPKSWDNDQQRRKACHIPALERHIPKTEMARQMVAHISSLLPLKPFWIGFDALYGTCLELLYWLDEQGHRFAAEIKTDTKFYLHDPDPCLPQHKNGKPYKYHKTDQKDISLKKYCQGLEDEDFTEMEYRNGTKGRMKGLFHRRTIWVWNKEYDRAIECELLLKKEGDQIKATWFNRSKDLPTRQLAYMQEQRYFVEQSFKEGKNQTALGDYQLRGWMATHRHLVCSMMALNFLTEQRHHSSKAYPHITIPDLVRFMLILIPSKVTTIEQRFEAFKDKHEHYEKQINSGIVQQRQT